MNIRRNQEIITKAAHCINLNIQEVKDILGDRRCDKVQYMINEKLFILKQELEILKNYVGFGYEWHFQCGVLEILKLRFSEVDKQKIREMLN